jgi:hypothetical protein
MDEKNLKQLLRDQRASSTKRGWRCPDDTKLAAYADQLLQGDLKESIERHLATCESCLAVVSFLMKSSESSVKQPVPAPLLIRARNLVSQPRSSTIWRWGWPATTAAAACLVVAVLLGIAFQLRQSGKTADESLVAKNEPPQQAVASFPSPPAVETPAAQLKSPGSVITQSPRPIRVPAPTVRRPPEPPSLSPTILFPTEGAMVAQTELVFRWVPITDAQFYDIAVMTDTGDLVFTGQSEQTQIKLPADVKLKVGNKYFVRVTANLPQGNTIKSPVVSFRVSR